MSDVVNEPAEEPTEVESAMGQAYQVIGALAHVANMMGDPAVIKALDYFSSNMFDPKFLPWMPPLPLIPKTLNDGDIKHLWMRAGGRWQDDKMIGSMEYGKLITFLRMIATEPERLKVELGRAYRAVRGLYSCVVKGKIPDQTMLAYHQPTIGAAIRFVEEGSIEGTEYFIGKHISVLHAVIEKAK
jgi:hypothetical protein